MYESFITHIIIYSLNVHAFAEVTVGFASLHYTTEEGTSGASLLEVCLQVFGSNTLSQASLVRVQTLPGSAQGLFNQSFSRVIKCALS